MVSRILCFWRAKLMAEMEGDVLNADGLDLYDDILISEEDDRISKLSKALRQCEEFQRENTKLTGQVASLGAELATMKKQNDVLKRNISVLYQTAKSEIERKTQLLRECQRKYDVLVFRRNRSEAKNAPSTGFEEQVRKNCFADESEKKYCNSLESRMERSSGEKTCIRERCDDLKKPRAIFNAKESRRDATCDVDIGVSATVSIESNILERKAEGPKADDQFLNSRKRNHHLNSGGDNLFQQVNHQVPLDGCNPEEHLSTITHRRKRSSRRSRHSPPNVIENENEEHIASRTSTNEENGYSEEMLEDDILRPNGESSDQERKVSDDHSPKFKRRHRSSTIRGKLERRHHSSKIRSKEHRHRSSSRRSRECSATFRNCVPQHGTVGSNCVNECNASRDKKSKATFTKHCGAQGLPSAQNLPGTYDEANSKKSGQSLKIETETSHFIAPALDNEFENSSEEGEIKSDDD